MSPCRSGSRPGKEQTLRWVENHLSPEVALVPRGPIKTRIGLLCHAHMILLEVFQEDLMVGTTGDFDRATRPYVIRTINDVMRNNYPAIVDTLDEFEWYQARVKGTVMDQRGRTFIRSQIIQVLSAIKGSYKDLYQDWVNHVTGVSDGDLYWERARVLLEQFLVKGLLEYWHWYDLYLRVLPVATSSGPMDRRETLGTSTPSKEFVF
jgi:hypothetical protein